MGKVYTTEEVCAILRVSRATVNRHIRRKLLISPARGRITVASVEKLLERGASCQGERETTKGRNGRTKKTGAGGGASGGKEKTTTRRMRTDRGRAKNATN